MSLGDELLTWTVTRDGMAHQRILDVRAAVLARLVREFNASCARGASLKLLEAQSEKLGSCLLGPAGSAIDEHEQLIMTPCGELNLLPFAALKWRGRWLGHQRTLSYLPSASMLLALSRPASSAPHSILAVGNPRDMGHQPPFGAAETLPALEYAETEARSIAGLYGARPLIGPEASIDEVRPKLRTHRQLHFATHGVLYDDAPRLSGVALANGYVLTVQELMGLRLDADLVAVSACRSGLGTRMGGEEIVGLSRGMLAAGARAVIVTLWWVPDLSTAILMVRFHEHMIGGLDAAAALKQAEVWLSELSIPELEAEKTKLRDFVSTPVATSGLAHPQHWAPFIVIGG